MAIVKNPELNKRVKEVRDASGLRQGEFATKIGIGQSSLSSIENISVNVSPRVFNDICKAFNINEHWFRTGEGEMFRESDTAILTLLQKEFNLPNSQLAVIETFLSISDEQRAAIVEFAADLCARVNKPTPTNEQPKPEIAASDIDQKLAEYRQELEAEQRAPLVCEDSDEKKNGTK